MKVQKSLCFSPHPVPQVL